VAACQEVLLANALVVRPRLELGVEDTKVAWPDHGMVDANPKKEVHQGSQVVAANEVTQMRKAYCGRKVAAAALAAQAVAPAAEPWLMPGHQRVGYLLLLCYDQV